jgi:hypothetical protein
MIEFRTPAEHPAVLRLIAEQYAVRIDQLARFIDSNRTSTVELADRLARLGCVEHRVLLAGQAEWIWLTKRGARESGTRFSGMRPQAGSLERISALNEVRLQVERRAPGARWISGRSIVREQGRRGFRPHAVIEIGDECHAIAIRLGYIRALETEVDFLETLMARYDALVVFASAKRLPLQQRLADERDWPKLFIRPIAKPPE